MNRIIVLFAIVGVDKVVSADTALLPGQYRRAQLRSGCTRNSHASRQAVVA